MMIMKRLMMAIAIALTMTMGAFHVSASTPASQSKSVTESLWKALPETLVVKQTATLDDGKTLTLYYKKTGNQCEVYTDADLKGLTVNDLTRLKESAFSIVTAAKGRCVYSVPVSKVRNMVKQAVNRYL